jgi:hypothetical protein
MVPKKKRQSTSIKENDTKVEQCTEQKVITFAEFARVTNLAPDVIFWAKKKFQHSDRKTSIEWSQIFVKEGVFDEIPAIFR